MRTDRSRRRRIYEDGELTGQRTRWHGNGQRQEEAHYEDGEWTGLGTGWHENGQKAGEGHFESGEMTGLWTTWYESGQKRSEGHYDGGERVGLHRVWYGSGQERSETYYDSEVPEGLHVKWYENGQKLAEELYEDGRLASVLTWTEEGAAIEPRRVGVPSETSHLLHLGDVDLFVFELGADNCEGVTIRGGPDVAARLFTDERSWIARERSLRFFNEVVYQCGLPGVVYVEVTRRVSVSNSGYPAQYRLWVED